MYYRRFRRGVSEKPIRLITKRRLGLVVLEALILLRSQGRRILTKLYLVKRLLVDVVGAKPRDPSAIWVQPASSSCREKTCLLTPFRHPKASPTP